jgi:hypothetical protein
MQAFYAATFDREMGCTEAEWLRWLPQAVGHPRWKLSSQAAEICIGDGVLNLSWDVASPRLIGLICMPVLKVQFRFERLDLVDREAFMRRFDLYMQRGGG